MYEALYALLLRLYPERFRAEYGDEAMQLFRDRLHNEQGLFPRFRFWLDIIMDLGLSLVREHRLASQTGPMPAAIPSDASGAPHLYVLEQGLPSTKCLVAGFASSMVIFVVISFAAVSGGKSIPGRAPSGESLGENLSAAWSFGSALLGQQRQADLSKLPDTPAAKRFREQFEVRKTGDYEALRHFYSQTLDPADEKVIIGNASTDVDMFRRFGPRNIFSFEIVESTQLRLVLLVQESGSTSYPNAWVRYEIEVTADPSHKISQQQFISFGLQKPSSETEIPPPPGFQLNDRKPADPAFPPGKAPWEKPFSVAASVLQSYVGTYDFDSPNNSSMLVTYREGQLYVQFSGQEEVHMFPETETKFYAEGRVMRWIEFARNENGQVTGLVLNSSGFELTGRRRK
jgi:hypothetical protein